MFKIIKKILIFIFIFTVYLPAYSQDYGSWDSMVKDYDDYEYGKTVSEEEVQNAIKTIKEHKGKKSRKSKKSKKRWYQIWKKKKFKKDKNFDAAKNKIHKTKVITGPKPMPKSKLPLLRLPFTLYYGKTLIPQGFYLIDAVRKNQNYYLQFKQGKAVIVEVPARDKVFEKPKSIRKSAFSTYEVINGAFLKIDFQKSNVSLETILPIYKD